MADKLTQTLISELTPLLRMLGSCSDGEAVNVVRIARTKLKAGGADFHDVVKRFENGTAAAAPSRHEIDQAFERGLAAGRAEAFANAKKAEARNGFDPGAGNGMNGHSWSEIAQFMAAKPDRLREKFERGFTSGMVERLKRRGPTPKEAACLRDIFQNRFGGRIS